MADMKKVYDDLMIIYLYIFPFCPFDIAKKSPRLQAARFNSADHPWNDSPCHRGSQFERAQALGAQKVHCF